MRNVPAVLKVVAVAVTLVLASALFSAFASASSAARQSSVMYVTNDGQGRFSDLVAGPVTKVRVPYSPNLVRVGNYLAAVRSVGKPGEFSSSSSYIQMNQRVVLIPIVLAECENLLIGRPIKAVKVWNEIRISPPNPGGLPDRQLPLAPVELPSAFLKH